MLNQDTEFRGKGISGNAIKLMALLFMTIDHMGLILFNDLTLLRIIGRLAFPLFAYMIAEGCRYTHNKYRRLLTVFLSGVIFQLVYSIYTKELFINIFLTFSFSILIITLLDLFSQKKKLWVVLLLVLTIIISLFISLILPLFINGFNVDYGFCGIFLPVAIFLCKDKKLKLLMVILFSAIFSLYKENAIYLWSSLAVIPLWFYNGKKGKGKIKYLFYLYYPLHLVILYFVEFLITSNK